MLSSKTPSLHERAAKLHLTRPPLRLMSCRKSTHAYISFNTSARRAVSIDAARAVAAPARIAPRSKPTSSKRSTRRILYTTELSPCSSKPGTVLNVFDAPGGHSTVLNDMFSGTTGSSITASRSSSASSSTSKMKTDRASSADPAAALPPVTCLRLSTSRAMRRSVRGSLSRFGGGVISCGSAVTASGKVKSSAGSITLALPPTAPSNCCCMFSAANADASKDSKASTVQSKESAIVCCGSSPGCLRKQCSATVALRRSNASGPTLRNCVNPPPDRASNDEPSPTASGVALPNPERQSRPRGRTSRRTGAVKQMNGTIARRQRCAEDLRSADSAAWIARTRPAEPRL
mmetsp:Transcript_43489/g.83481  ORF Transcript_43489/g.83481 Transcript_43489/m.83481 type:complete len:347 (-) Transcript_43489:352-1392(-)